MNLRASLHSVLLLCLLQLTGRGQSTFDHYYSTGYHTNRSSNVIAVPDSNFVFVNYTIDSATYRMDMGLIRLDKYGSELVNKSFNMFDNTYGYFSGVKNFIDASPSSYILSGAYVVGSNQGFIITKFNKTTLDTIKNIIYADSSFSYGINNFIKFNDNKYYFIGNKWTGNHEQIIIFHLDSNLNILQKINLNTPPDFGLKDVTYNPIHKKILLAGGTASGQYLNTFYYIDTLGTLTQAAFGPKYMDRSIVQVNYSSVDTSYLAVGSLEFNSIGNYYTKLCLGKYDVNFNLKWERTYGDAMPGNYLIDGVLMADGSIIVSGTYASTASQPFGNSNGNGVILKTDKDGNLLWAREYDHVGPGNRVEMFYGVDKTLDKGFILCGSVVASPGNRSKAWAVKTDSLGCVVPGCASSSLQVTTINYPPPPPPPYFDPSTPNPVGIPEPAAEAQGIRIYPNPASQAIHLVFPPVSASANKQFQVKVLNTLGQAVIVSDLAASPAKLDISALEKGIYFIQVENKEKRITTQKFIKE